MTKLGLDKLYDARFSRSERVAKDAIWRVLCSQYFQQFVKPSATVLDVACGYGEFVRHIRAARKIAIDLNQAVAAELPGDVEFYCTSAADMSPVASASVDLCFASNFFEHLESRQQMDAVLSEAKRVLKPGGRFLCMQPNIRYAADKYWDFYDHILPLSHLSAAEAFRKNGYLIERLVPRFVPFSTKSAYPKHPFFVSAYLRFPPLWRLLGGQFVLVATTPSSD